MDLISPSILEPLCDRVINAALDDCNSVTNSEEIKNLSTTVLNIKEVLQHAERRQPEGRHGTSAWLKSLKQILLDAEDLLDEVATVEAIRSRDNTPLKTEAWLPKVLNFVPHFSTVKGIRGREESALLETGLLPKVLKFVPHFSNALGRATNGDDLAHRLQNIKKKLDHISRLKDRLNLLRAPTEYNLTSTGARRRLVTSSLPESQIIGRDVEIQQLEKLLLGSAEAAAVQSTDCETNLQVVSVFGMGGVGKTTLVKHAYNNPEVKAYFELSMWVCVSHDFDVKRIIEEIMSAASVVFDWDSELSEESNWKAAQRLLRSKLHGKRFLLVLDDVWEENPSEWENLRSQLLSGGRGSKIVVTTRSQKVSTITKGTPISLKGLSKKDMWTLFQRYAFGNNDVDEHSQMSLLGREIADNLGGLPLAAKTIGRLFYVNHDAEHWTNILKSKAWEEVTAKEDNILSILKLSYDHLPGNLKECFIYCSIFPEDHRLHKGELVHLWMAQQFIQTTGCGDDEEELGSEYFDNLSGLSLIENSPYWDGYYAMHDLIHNLADSISVDDCVRLEYSHFTNSNSAVSETVRHVSFVNKLFDQGKMEEELCKHGSLRTLLFLDGSPFQFDRLQLHNIFMRLQTLRVLGLSDCKIVELPESIGTLKHLRLLDLSFNGDINTLPESLGDLHNLQVLNLDACLGICSLPKSMSALINLRHIDVSINKAELISNIGGVGSMRALRKLIFDCSKHEQPMKELANLSMLRYLRIGSLAEIKSQKAAIESRLKEKEHLKELALDWRPYYADQGGSNLKVLDEEVAEVFCPPSSVRSLRIHNYGGIRSPRWMEDEVWILSSLLEDIDFWGCSNWEVLPPLGLLPCLRSLSIRRMKGVKRIGPHFLGYFSVGDCKRVPPMFPSLETLYFSRVDEWEVWEEVPPQQRPTLCFPRLKKLGIEDCPKLRQLPPLPSTLTTIQISNAGLSELPGWSPLPTPSPSSSPLPSLSCLKIKECPNLVSLAEGLLRHPLPMLVNLEIIACPGLVSVPETGFGHLTSLEQLEFSDSNKPRLAAIPALADAQKPSLERTNICGQTIDVLMQAIHLGSEKLTRLTRLSIVGGCSLPHSVISLGGDRGSLPSSLQEVEFSNNDTLDTDTLSAWLRGLTSLRKLTISECPAIVSLPGAETLSDLAALVYLKIMHSKGLRHLGQGVHCLTSLESLIIGDCPNLVDVTAANSSSSSSTTSSHTAGKELKNVKELNMSQSTPQQMKMLLRLCPSVRKLVISDCPQLTNFGGDEGDDAGEELESALLQLSPTLRGLELTRCLNLQSLPTNLRRLSSLHVLKIFYCSQIRRFPVGGLPQSLGELGIGECTYLQERLKDKEGEDCDWPLISHIPKLSSW